MLLRELATSKFKVIEGDSVRVGEKTFRKAKVDRNESLVLIDANLLEELWKHDSLYIGHGPTYQNHIGNRIDGFKEYLDNNDDIEAANIHVSKRRNLISFGNGRHRTRVLIERGYDMIPVTMGKEALANLKSM